MNTLTTNRILQEGDQYKDKDGTWKAVPTSDFGLQIMFTPYKEVRRPSEESKPISPDSGDSVKADPVAKAESEQKTPVPTHSGTGVTLPTVVSKKAHNERQGIEADGLDTRIRKLAARIEVPPHGSSDPKVAPFPASINPLIIQYPDKEREGQIWTGRNGTFNQTALNLNNVNGIIEVRPRGKRGLAQNALITIPAEVIPSLVDWLLRQQTTPKT